MGEVIHHRRRDNRPREKERQTEENQHQADTTHSDLIFRIAAIGANRVEPRPVSALLHLAVGENPVIDGGA